MDVARQQLELSDGRSLDVYVAGEEDAIPILSHHGTPGSGLPYRPFVEEAVKRGLRLVASSRPGYGDSTRAEGRTVADCAADAAAVLDALGADRCFVTGGSGGGPHALACAALLPDRVIAAATIASVAPFGVEDLDFADGMGPENVEEFRLAVEDHEGLRAFMEKNVDEWADVTGEQVAAALGGLVSEPDRAALSGELGDHMVRSFREAVKEGVWGWFDDDLAFVKDWGFELDAIRVPVTIWQGEQDLMVPPAHGRWLMGRLPGVRGMLEPDHGHLSLAVGSLGRVFDDLLGRASWREELGLDARRDLT
jgi:pimeloyl-ACP methyl ester carboxylesterase